MAGDDQHRDRSGDQIPMLEDIVRPGSVDPGQIRDSASSDASGDSESQTDLGALPLSDAEIEAIATRVVERHIGNIEQAVARAIRTAIRIKNRPEREDAGSQNRGG
jgi:hypothetical protein